MNPNPNPQPTSPLRIIRATERIYVQHPIFLLIGQPGIGKSSLAFSAEGVVVLNCDSESAHARVVNRGDSLPLLTLEELRYLEEHPEFLDAFSTIAIDTAGKCVQTMAAAIVDEVPKYGLPGGLTQQGWGSLKRRFDKFLTNFRSRGKNILLISHSKEDKNGDAVYMRPAIDGGTRDAIMQAADFVGYLYMNGKQRVLDFNPTDSWFGKNPAQWPAWNVPEPEKARTFMTQLFQMGREALGKCSEKSANVAQQVDDFRAVFVDYKTLEDFNAGVPTVQKLAEPLKSQVGALLIASAEKRGFKFEKEAKRFVAPVEVPQVQSPAGSLF